MRLSGDLHTGRTTIRCPGGGVGDATELRQQRHSGDDLVHMLPLHVVATGSRRSLCKPSPAWRYRLGGFEHLEMTLSPGLAVDVSSRGLRKRRCGQDQIGAFGRRRFHRIQHDEVANLVECAANGVRVRTPEQVVFRDDEGLDLAGRCPRQRSAHVEPRLEQTHSEAVYFRGDQQQGRIRFAGREGPGDVRSRLDQTRRTPCRARDDQRPFGSRQRGSRSGYEFRRFGVRWLACMKIRINGVGHGEADLGQAFRGAVDAGFRNVVDLRGQHCGIEKRVAYRARMTLDTGVLPRRNPRLLR